MGNVIGKSFDKYVIDQVNQRQNKLGTGNRSVDTIQLTNNKTSFLRLAVAIFFRLYFFKTLHLSSTKKTL